MDHKKILSSDYLDLLFDGKNKQYGGYELRKKYHKRATLAAGIVLGIIALSIGTSMAIPEAEYIPPPPFPPSDTVVLTAPPPTPKDEPPPPKLPATPPPPKRASFTYSVPKIQKNNQVNEEQIIEDPNKDENKNRDIGNENRDGEHHKKYVDNPFGDTGKGTGTKIAGDGSDNDETVHITVDDKAKPPKGWMDLVRQNLRYPAMAKAIELDGRVMVSFIVEKDGSISSVKALNDPGGGLADEAVRVIKDLPKFEPAMRGGKPARFAYRLPVTFRLNR